MCRFINAAILLGLAWIPAYAGMTYPSVGRPATPAEIRAWDIDVRPDFKGLPPGSGSVAQGQVIWDAKCATCHGTFGESNEIFAPLVGGTNADDIKTGRARALAVGGEARTTIMKLATISTLWDYINRAMPWNAPKSLKTDEVYAVVAYLLNLGDVLPNEFVLSDRNIAEVQARLPNRNGMTREHGMWDVRGKPDVKNVACMKDCPTEAKVASSLPKEAAATHGNLAEQNRSVGPVRGAQVAPSGPKVAAAVPAAELARGKACMGCHGVDRALVGPAFNSIAARYQGKPEMESRLVEKLKTGGSGAWGSVPMPAQPELAEKDARALVRWVLSGAL